MKRQLQIMALTGLIAALPSIAAAQFPPPPVADRWPQPAQPAAPQQPQQPQTQQPARQQPQQPPRQAAPAPDPDAPKPVAKPKPAAAPANAVTCGGAFAKDATHLKLAIKYDSRNIVFGDVDGPDGSKIKATILYPNDPKRRLEVIWNNDAARTDLSLVVINGQSQWASPKGLKVGTTLAAVEKINGKPFKLGGFGTDGIGSALGWEGGALGTIPGGCKIGIRVALDAKAAPDARTAIADKELLSNDANLRAANAKIVEILVGY